MSRPIHRTKGKRRSGREVGELRIGSSSKNVISTVSKAMKFYRSCPWDKWWTEFITSREKTGALTYSTSWALARAKGKSKLEQEWIFRCIGPKPIARPLSAKQKKRILPYLGDWQITRAKAYFYDNDSVDNMRKVVKERLDGLEAGRGSATVILDLIAKWMKYDDKIDEAFHFTPVNPEVSDVMKEKMVDRFLKLKNKTRVAIQNLVTQYLQCHGISTDGLNDLGALVMAVSQSAAKGALAGVATGAAAANSGQLAVQESPALNMLARAIMDKSKIFSMQLPSVLVGDKDEG